MRIVPYQHNHTLKRSSASSSSFPTSVSFLVVILVKFGRKLPFSNSKFGLCSMRTYTTKFPCIFPVYSKNLTVFISFLWFLSNCPERIESFQRPSLIVHYGQFIRTSRNEKRIEKGRILSRAVGVWPFGKDYITTLISFKKKNQKEFY